MKLFKYRKSQKLTLEKASFETGIPIATWWRIENIPQYGISHKHACIIKEWSKGTVKDDDL
jgi:hypothetical protein